MSSGREGMETAPWPVTAFCGSLFTMSMTVFTRSRLPV